MCHSFKTAEEKALDAIYAAIVANPNAVTELTPETICKLERITSDWRTLPANEKNYFKYQLKLNYEEWRERLSIKIEILKIKEEMRPVETKTKNIAAKK